MVYKDCRFWDTHWIGSCRVIHLFQPDSLELRGHMVMFQNTTLQGQAGLSQELCRSVMWRIRNSWTLVKLGTLSLPPPPPPNPLPPPSFNPYISAFFSVSVLSSPYIPPFVVISHSLNMILIFSDHRTPFHSSPSPHTLPHITSFSHSLFHSLFSSLFVCLSNLKFHFSCSCLFFSIWLLSSPPLQSFFFLHAFAFFGLLSYTL